MSNPAYYQVAKVIVDKASALSKAERIALKSLLDGFDDQPQIPFPSYSVTVDYDLTVEQLIKAGKYDWFNNEVTPSHFPSKEKGKAELLVYLVNFNCKISSVGVIKELNRQGLRHATLKELLALGAAQPDLQRTDPIVALGSTWCDSCVIGEPYDYLMVPFLRGGESNRDLELVPQNGGGWWHSSWQFATVAKSEKLTKK